MKASSTLSLTLKPSALHLIQYSIIMDVLPCNPTFIASFLDIRLKLSKLPRLQVVNKALRAILELLSEERRVVDKIEVFTNSLLKAMIVD